MLKRITVCLAVLVLGLALFQAEGLSSPSLDARVQALASSNHELEKGIMCHTLVRGNPFRPEVALTFDDGPHPAVTRRLLDILKREGVPATFFVVGKVAEAHPDVVRREILEGHEVANHTYDHARLPGLAPERIAWELQEGSRALMRITGSPVRVFRPPGGEHDRRVRRVARELGCVMVLWNDDPGDYANPGSHVIESRTLRHVSNGEIILLHDGVEQTVAMLPDLIHTLKERGFRFVTCSQMALQRGVVTAGGPVVLPHRP